MDLIQKADRRGVTPRWGKSLPGSLGTISLVVGLDVLPRLSREGIEDLESGNES